MENIASALKNLDSQNGQLSNVLLQGVLEGLMEGVLILTERREVLHANRRTHRIVEQLSQDELEPRRLDREIWRIHQTVLDLGELCSESPVIVESDMLTHSLGTLHIQARRFELTTLTPPLILVTLQDQCQVQRLAIDEVQHYGLTPREMQILSLRRADYTYKEIAAQLFITLNTVKKHLKSIYAKTGFTSQHRKPLLRNC